MAGKLVFKKRGQCKHDKYGFIDWRTIEGVLYFSIVTPYDPEGWFYEWLRDEGWKQLEKYHLYYFVQDKQITDLVHRCDEWLLTEIKSQGYDRVFYFGTCSESGSGADGPSWTCDICKYKLTKEQSMLLQLHTRFSRR
jgi:hypothetical protein